MKLKTSEREFSASGILIAVGRGFRPLMVVFGIVLKLDVDLIVKAGTPFGRLNPNGKRSIALIDHKMI